MDKEEELLTTGMEEEILDEENVTDGWMETATNDAPEVIAVNPEEAPVNKTGIYALVGIFILMLVVVCVIFAKKNKEE